MILRYTPVHQNTFQRLKHPLMVEGNVVELRNLPQYSYDDTDQWINQILMAFFDTQIIIDKGTEQSVADGDYFMVVENEKKVTSLTGEEIGTIQEEGSLIKAVTAYQKFSICKLESY